MDSSSEESFVWANASIASSDSEVKINDAMEKGDPENESDSGKSYKEKLQNKLFTEINEGDQQASKHPHRKRKLSSRKSDCEHVQTSKKKKIKKEPESDNDGFKATSHLQKSNGDDDSYNETYLNSKVKVEEHFALPSPNKLKKKRNKTISYSDNFNQDSYDKLNKSKNYNNDFSWEETEPDNGHLNMLVQEENEYHDRKSKKKKKKKTSKTRDSAMSDIESMDCSVQEDIPEEEHLTPSVGVGEPPDSASSSTGPRKQKEKRRKNKKSLPHSNGGDLIVEQTDTINEFEEPVNVNKNVSFDLQSETSKRKPKLSERIQFEDDESSDVNISQSLTKSDKIQNFLSNNLNLKPFNTQLETQSVLTADDEIWLIDCPRDIDVDDFQNKDIALEGKCKLQLNGQTYEGIVDNIHGNMSILTSERHNYVIKSLFVKGCVSLRKRIPKSHVHQATMVNNQTNFIPLPETKCRHPLFGSSYKKDIKLPAAVAERLRAGGARRGPHAPGPHAPGPPGPHAPAPPPRNKKYRAAKENTTEGSSKQPKVDPSAEASVKPERDSEHNTENNKKKKNRDNKDNDLGKVKRKKHDIESADAWESERAIEQNLFDF